MNINIEKLIEKVEIHNYGNEPQEVLGLENIIFETLGETMRKSVTECQNNGDKDHLLPSEIASTLALYKEKLREYTQKCTPALAEDSKYCNRIGLERDLDLLWASFRALEDFIKACKLCDAENKSYAPFQVSAYADKHLPKLYGQRPEPCSCPPPNECGAKE